MILGALWLTSCGAPLDAGQADSSGDLPPPSPALWEATGPQGERAWLFGTIHSLPDGAEWRTPALEQVLAETDLLMVEIAELGEREVAAASFESRAYDVGLPPFLNRIPAEQRAMIAASLEEAEIDPDSLIHTETWAAALQLGNAVSCSDPANGVDRALLAQFDGARSLESFDRQFAIFDGLPQKAQVDLLVSVAEESDCAAGQDRRLAWLTGDVEALERSIFASFRGNTDLREDLVDDRNTSYVQSIVQYQALYPQTDLLVAVGVGHMIGDTGVPAQLAARGYTITRIQ